MEGRFQSPTPRGASAYWSRGIRLPQIIDRMGLPFELRQAPGARVQELRIRLGPELVRWEIPVDLIRLSRSVVRIAELDLAGDEADLPALPVVDQGICVVGEGFEAAEYFAKCHLRGRLMFELKGTRLWGGFVMKRQPLRAESRPDWFLCRAAIARAVTEEQE